MKNRGRKTIDGVDKCKSSLTLKFLKLGGKKKEGMYRVKNVAMFSLSTPILLRGVGTKALNKSVLLGEKRKKSGVFIFQGIISAKDFEMIRELSVNYVSKHNISVR